LGLTACLGWFIAAQATADEPAVGAGLDARGGSEVPTLGAGRAGRVMVQRDGGFARGMGEIPCASCDNVTCTSLCQNPDPDGCIGQLEGSVGCHIGDTTSDNAYMRLWAKDEALPDGLNAQSFEVKCVTFYLQSMPTVDFEVDVVVYQTTSVRSDFDPPALNPDSIGIFERGRVTITVDHTLGDGAEVQADFGECGPFIVANRTMLVELIPEDLNTVYGDVGGGFFGVNDNAAHDMTDAFLRSPTDCDVDDWTTVTAIGFPDSEFVIEVDGILAGDQPMGACCWSDGGDPASWTCAWQNENACLANPTHHDVTWHCLTPCEELDPQCGKGACCYDNVTIPDQRDCVDNITESECLSIYAGRRPHLIIHTNCDPELDCSPIPDNDNCTSAITLTGYCVSNVVFNSANAKSDYYPDETTDSGTFTDCLNDGATPATGYAPVNDVWYKYEVPTALGDGDLIVSTRGSSFNTAVAIYAHSDHDCTLDCPDGVNGVAIAQCNADTVPYQTNSGMTGDYRLTARAVVLAYNDGALPGECVWIRIGGHHPEASPFDDDAPGGDGLLNITYVPLGYGLCCAVPPGGDCLMVSDEFTCEDTMGGYWRTKTDFLQGFDYYEDGGDTDWRCDTFIEDSSVAGCCDFEACPPDGNACYNAIDLGSGATSVTVDTHNVTYFKWKPLTADGDPWDRTSYGVTIDTCGSGYESTVLTVYEQFDPLAWTNGDCTGETQEHRKDLGLGTNIVAINDDCDRGEEPDAETLVSCHNDGSGNSCLCLTVDYLGLPGTLIPDSASDYYIVVGAEDGRGTGYPCRGQGIDPVPNFDLFGENQQFTLTIAAVDECWNCKLSCDCKGDIDVDGDLDGDDIQGFITALLGPALDCTTDAFCRMNMNDDSTIDIDDVPSFVAALLAPWGCGANTDPLDCDVAPIEYCQQGGEGNGYFGVITELPFYSAENFVSLEGGFINHICWFGTYADFDPIEGFGTGTCPLKNADWEITYFFDDGGEPGGVKAGPFLDSDYGAGTITKSATGAFMPDGEDLEYVWAMDHPEVVVGAGECVWIQITPYSSNHDDDCWWEWSASPDGDGTSAGGGTFDFAFCVNVPLWEDSCLPVCTVDCAGATPEGEPDCYDGRPADTYNGGCSEGGSGFTAIACGDEICGKSGVFKDASDPNLLVADEDWYSITLTEAQKVFFTVTATFRVEVGVLIADGLGSCPSEIVWYPDGVTPTELATDTCEEIEVQAWLGAGTWFLLVRPDVDYPFVPECGAEYLIRVRCEDCPTYNDVLVSCPHPTRLDYTESEACGEDINGGCDTNPPAFDNVSCSDTICGTIWAESGQRDTDWYRVVMPTDGILSLTLTSEFPGIVQLWDVVDCSDPDWDAHDKELLSAAYSEPNAEAPGNAGAEVEAGTYYIRVRTGSDNIPARQWGCLPCDSNNDYELIVECNDPPVQSCQWYSVDTCQPPDHDLVPGPHSDLWGPPSEGDSPQILADNFWVLTGDNITHICWWGTMTRWMTDDWTNGCPVPGGNVLNWTVTIYGHDGGTNRPDINNVIAEWNFEDLEGIETGIDYGAPFGKLYRWETELPGGAAVTPGNCYWVSVYNDARNSPADTGCSFQWKTSEPYDGIGDDRIARNDTGAAGDFSAIQNQRWGDLAWCLDGESLTFSPTACGPIPTGACCVAGTCAGTTTQAECNALGGNWWAEGETCPAYVCDASCATANASAYCTASGGDVGSGGETCEDEYISLVILDPSLYNESDCSDGAYEDYSGTVCTYVHKGMTYDLTLEFFSTNNIVDFDGPGGMVWGVWIDFNRDGDFDDLDEQVVDDEPTWRAYKTHKIDVPAGASTGATIMRVKLDRTGGATTTPCGAGNYGEVEDYSIEILP
jgi:hypothetical protein